MPSGHCRRHLGQSSPFIIFSPFFSISVIYIWIPVPSLLGELGQPVRIPPAPAASSLEVTWQPSNKHPFKVKAPAWRRHPPQPSRFTLMFPCRLYNEELWDEVTCLAGTASLLLRIHPSGCHYYCYYCCHHVWRREKSLSVSVPAPESPSVLWLLVHIFAQRAEWMDSRKESLEPQE